MFEINSKKGTQNHQQKSKEDPTKEEFLTCPSCEKEGKKFNFYTCCLTPYCKVCYDGFHYFECKKKVGEQQHTSPVFSDQQCELECQRCENTLSGEYYICQQCNNAKYCEQCLTIMHSSGKFLAHTSIKSHAIFRSTNASNLGKNQVLKCGTHKLLRNIINDQGILICSTCLSENKGRKIRTIDFLGKQTDVLLKEVQQRIQNFSQQFWLKQQEHSTKWNELKEKTKSEYERIIFKVKQKYEQNMSVLDKIQELDKKIIKQAVEKCRKTEKQLKWGQQYHKNSKDISTFVARLNLLAEELVAKKKLVLTTEHFTHKIGQIETEKLDNLLKSYIVQKTKVRENQERDVNASLRKSNQSLSKYKDSESLANSRKSLMCKSIRKSDDLPTSTKSLRKNPQFESSTSVGKKNIVMSNYMSSSGKKNGYNSGLAKHSILSAKIEDMNIQPTALSFDAKQLSSQTNLRSKINFASSKTEEVTHKSTNLDTRKPEHQQILSSFSSVNQENNPSMAGEMFNRVSKRKSDYFDLRERMRKPNVANNRFARK